MPDRQSCYTVITGSADGEPCLEVVSAAELRARLTPDADGDTYYGRRDDLKIVTRPRGLVDLAASLDEAAIIVLRGEPVNDSDISCLIGYQPSRRPTLPPLVAFDLTNPHPTEG